MITVTIEDSVGSLTLKQLGVPLVIETIEGATDVVTLDNNMRTDFTNPKRQISIPYDSLTEEQFNDIKAFYDRQYTLFEYPLINISHYGITDMACRMYLSPRNVYNNCGSVENVTITFRESVQLPAIGSS